MCRFLRMVSRVPSGTTNRCCARRGSSCHGSLLSLTEVEQSSATAESMLAEQSENLANGRSLPFEASLRAFVSQARRATSRLRLLSVSSSPSTLTSTASLESTFGRLPVIGNCCYYVVTSVQFSN